MRIGELARLTDSTPRALRHYESAGLITSVREANGYRDYAGTTAVRVRNIRHLLSAGLTLEDVRVFLPCLDGDIVTAAPSREGLRVAARLAALDARIAAQQAVRNTLATARPPHAASEVRDDMSLSASYGDRQRVGTEENRCRTRTNCCSRPSGLAAEEERASPPSG